MMSCHTKATYQLQPAYMTIFKKRLRAGRRMIHASVLSTMNIVLERSGIFACVMYCTQKTSLSPQSHTCTKAFSQTPCAF